MKNFNNLSKLFRYVNENGDSVTFDYAGGYLINKPTGIDTVTVSLSQAKGINQTGATIQSKNVQPRPVNINGYLVGDGQAASKEKLISVIRPDLAGKLYADDYYLNVWPTATPSIEAKHWGAQFQFSLLAAYPYWCKDDSAAVTLSGIQMWLMCKEALAAQTTLLLRLSAMQPGTIAGKCGSKLPFGRKMTNLRLIAKPVRVLMDRWSWESESDGSPFPYPSTRKIWASITLWGTLYRAYLPGLGYRSAPGLRALSTPWTATKPGQKLSWATLFLQHWGQ